MSEQDTAFAYPRAFEDERVWDDATCLSMASTAILFSSSICDTPRTATASAH